MVLTEQLYDCAFCNNRFLLFCYLYDFSLVFVFTRSHCSITAAAATTAYSIKNIKSTEANLDKPPNEFVKLTPENIVRMTNQKPCKNLSVDDYLLTKTHSRKIVNVDHFKPIDDSKHLPISIDVRHDRFDTKYGLVRNIVYTGMY